MTKGSCFTPDCPGVIYSTFGQPFCRKCQRLFCTAPFKVPSMLEIQIARNEIEQKIRRIY